MAIGFNIGGVYGQIIPDKNLQQQTMPRLRKMSFGDGYEQRSTKGINNTEETYSVSFKNSPKQDIDNIA